MILTSLFVACAPLQSPSHGASRGAPTHVVFVRGSIQHPLEPRPRHGHASLGSAVAGVRDVVGGRPDGSGGIGARRGREGDGEAVGLLQEDVAEPLPGDLAPIHVVPEVLELAGPFGGVMQ